MKVNQITTQTQWGNNIIININVNVKEGQLPNGFFEKLKERVLSALTSSEDGIEKWKEYQKVGLDGGTNVFGHLPKEIFEK